ncbi:MAG TPA: hypothetical protein P5184_10850 [Bacteroidales bacterium]|nr:hypothetical protein [Bacteroidales bacterium]
MVHHDVAKWLSFHARPEPSPAVNHYIIPVREEQPGYSTGKYRSVFGGTWPHRSPT